MYSQKSLGLGFLIVASFAYANEAPTANWSAPDRVTADRPAELRIECRWVRDPGGWEIAPPKLPPFEGAAWSLGRVEAQSDVEGSAVTYYASITAPAGVYTVPAISLAARNVESGEEETVFADPIRLHVANAPAVSPIMIGVVAGVLGAVLLAAVVRYRRRRSSLVAAGGSDQLTADEMEDPLAAAKKHRIEGDVYGYYRVLTEAARGDANLSDRLRQTAEDVGFRGLEVAPDRLDSDYRAVERVFSKRKGD